MIKKLLVGASALAFASAAYAGPGDGNIVASRAQSSQTAVSIAEQQTVPVQGAEVAANKAAIDSATSKAAQASANAGVTGVFDPPSGGGVAAYYTGSVAGVGGVAPGSDTGDKAAIDTVGDNNEGIVDQLGGSAGWAAIDQKGSYNQANIDQNDTGVGGTANAALIQQISPSSGPSSFTQKAEINQVHFGPAFAGQNAAIIQGGVSTAGAGADGTNNSARIDQSGGSQPALYGGMLNDSAIVQANSANTAYIQQGNGGLGASSDHAVIQQSGNGDAGIYQAGLAASRAFVYQGAGTSLKADVIQTFGTNDLAAVHQDAPGANLQAFVNQSFGNNNSAFVDQSGATIVSAYGEIFQTGSNNVALVQQNNTTVMNGQVNQNGNANYGGIFQ